eukprot:381945_1
MSTLVSNEYFYKYSNQIVTVNDTKDVCTGCATCYGALVIPSMRNGTYEWTFQSNKGGGGCSIAIGIDEHVAKWINTRFCHKTETISYAYYAWGSGAYKVNSNKSEAYGEGLEKNHKISMILDFSSSSKYGTLSFSKDGKDLGIAYQNIKRANNIKYRMAVCPNTSTDSCQLLCFKQNIIESDDSKVSDIDNTNVFNYINAGNYHKMRNELDTLKQKLQNVEKLNSKFANEIKTLKKTNETVTNEATQAKNEQQSQIEKLKNEMNAFMNDKKEMELQINELKLENKQLKDKLKQIPLDYNNWKQWDSNEVLAFIFSIYDDGSLDEYKQTIQNEILNSEYCGEDLEGLELNDIKSMGIKKIKIRKGVYNAIRQLTQNKYNNNNKNMNEKGEENISNAPTAYI